MLRVASRRAHGAVKFCYVLDGHQDVVGPTELGC